MTGDLIDQLFEDPPPPEPDQSGLQVREDENLAVEDTDEYFPGSRRHRRDKPIDPVKDDAPWRDYYTVKSVNGVPRKFYTIGALAEALQMSVASVRRWTTMGRLPQAPYRLPLSIVDGRRYPGRRLYTEPMIEAAIASFVRRGLLTKARIEWGELHDMTIEIHDAWVRIHAWEKQEYAAAADPHRSA